MRLSDIRKIRADLTQSKIYRSLATAIPPERWAVGDRGDVLLLQGLGHAWTPLTTLGERLSKLGYRVHVVAELNKNTCTFNESLRTVKRYLVVNDLHDLVVIGHSRGGLAAAHLLLDPEIRPRIRRVISLAAPYGGSHMAWFGKGNFIELVPRSACTLLTHPYAPMIVNIYPRLDHRVVPQKCLLLDGATNIQTDLVGHVGVLDDPEVFKLIEHHMDT